jgi:small subunit ribosomal protein S11
MNNMTNVETKQNIKSNSETVKTKKDASVLEVKETESSTNTIETKDKEESKKLRKPKKVKKNRRNLVTGVVHIQASFNNTVVTISDLQGNVVVWSSAGKMGFKGSKKSTPYVAQLVTMDVINRAKECGLQSVKVEVKGPGMGRESSLRALSESKISIISIEDVTFHPHNGCRPKKKRRV